MRIFLAAIVVIRGYVEILMVVHDDQFTSQWILEQQAYVGEHESESVHV